jgi:hypothetical protein
MLRGVTETIRLSPFLLIDVSTEYGHETLFEHNADVHRLLPADDSPEPILKGENFVEYETPHGILPISSFCRI